MRAKLTLIKKLGAKVKNIILIYKQLRKTYCKHQTFNIS